MSSNAPRPARSIRSVHDHSGPLTDAAAAVSGSDSTRSTSHSTQGRSVSHRATTPPANHQSLGSSVVSPQRTPPRRESVEQAREAEPTPITAARHAAIASVLQAKLASDKATASPLSRLQSLTESGKVESSGQGVIDWLGFSVPARYLEHYELAQGNTAEAIGKIRQRWVPFTSRANEPNANPQLSIELCYNVRHADELSTLVDTAVPHEHRIRLWLIKSGALALQHENPELFRSLVLCNLNAPAPATELIRADMPRTFPTHEVFLNGDGKDRLQRVLSAFAWKNPQIGYCRGMNLVGGILTLLCDDDEAFWLLNSVSSSLFPDMYAPNLAGLQTDIRALGHLVRIHLKDIHQKFQSLGVVLEVATAHWFLSLFAGELPSDTLMRAWDQMFAHGPHTFFHLCLAVIASHRIELLAAVAVEEAVQILRDAPKTLYNFDALSKLVTRNMRAQMTRELIGELRKHHRESVDRDLAKLKHRREIGALRQAAVHNRLDVDDIEQLNLEFRAVADAQTSTINEEQFGKLIAPLFKPDAIRDVHAVFGLFDRNKDNKIDFRELMLGLAVASNGSVAQRLRLVFHAFDLDSSGFISKDEFLKMMLAIDGTVCEKLIGSSSHQAFVDKVFPNLDLDHDGHLDFDEFQRATRIHPQLMHCFALGVAEDDFHDRVSQRHQPPPAEYDIVEEHSGGGKKDRGMCDNCVIS